ncbi:MAG: 23S rRNA (uracil(1939)-C(5))-methyltransferase RlmD [Lachnospiraceae bacterium]|nr:23S rRNA (uracil(1939)-C(5))-methyltransferase RlmD [Lachnospiraceae bacterium]
MKKEKETLEKELEQWIADFYKQSGQTRPMAGQQGRGGQVSKKGNNSQASENGRTGKDGQVFEKRKTGKDGQVSEKKQAGRGSQVFEKEKSEKSSQMPEKGKLGKGGQASEKQGQRKAASKSGNPCPVADRCGGCQLLHLPYDKQLKQKQELIESLLKGICPVHPIIGMENPWHYRNKVHAVFDHDKKGNPISGVYEAGSHRVVPVERCLIEDEKADEIIGTIRGMLKSFKIRTFDEDSGYGLLRHVLIRRGFSTGQIMTVLVTASPVFPSKNNFVKALRQKHPEITTIVQNINDRNTSMVLGDKETVLYGKGYIEDTLCGRTFRISSKSFYQINPVQTEKLYGKAIELAALTGKELVIDAYCGIGTIGIIAAAAAGKVIGVELNQDAVRDAVSNAKANHVENIRFYCNDASLFLSEMAQAGEKADVVIMDPPRSGSTEVFMKSVKELGPSKVVYISCGPQSLARDLKNFKTLGYQAKEAWPFDLFPGTKEHVETVVLLTRNKAEG